MNWFSKGITQLLAATTLVLSGASQAGAQAPEAGQKPITVTIFGLPSGSSATPRDIAENRVLAEFRRLHPNIHLKSVTGLKIEGLGSEIGPLMMIAGGISPDIISVNFRKIDSYVQQGLLYPMDEFIEQEIKKNPDWMAQHVLPQVEDVIRRPGRDGIPQVYALPYRYLVMGLYYNRPLFRQAGLPERAPKDWDEMVEFSQKILALNPQENRPLMLSSGQQASWNLMNFLWSTGADAVEEVAPNDWRAVFNSEGAVDAFTFYYRLIEGERLKTGNRLAVRGNTGEILRSPEVRGLGMHFGYIGDSVNLDPNVWGFGAVPVGPKGIRGSEINAAMYGIFAGVKDPAVRQAAWTYINFVASEEAQRIRTQTLVDLGMTNQINPVDLRRFGYTSLLELTPKGLEEEFKIAMANGKPEPYGKNCSLVYLEMTYPLDQILLSGEISNAWAAGDIPRARNEIKRILDRAVGVTNERMLGIIPPGEMQKRRIVAWIVVICIVAAFAYVVRVIFKSFSHVGRATTRARGKQKAIAWLLLLIPLGLTFVWSYLPAIRGAAMALLDYQIMLKSSFVGIDNFANTLYDNRFWGSILATLHFAFWMLTVGFFVPITLAYLLHLVPRHKLIFRTIYYLPALLSGAAVFILWKELFSVNGLMNNFMGLFGVEMHRAWPEDPMFAMLACVIPGVWSGAGPGCLIYLAALKTIPEEQFEASEIDGAGFFSKTFHIVFPALMPLIIINFVGAVMAAFHASQNILIMTAGGPNGLTEVAALRIFYQAFMFLQFGPATAMAWIVGSMLLGFALIQLRRLSRMEFRSGG